MDHSQHMTVTDFSYLLALTAGLLGSGHCIGMCGGLVSGFFLRFAGQDRLWRPVVVYHVARLLVYGLIGLIAAALGTVLIRTGPFGDVEKVLQVVAGVVVILLGLETLGVSPWRLTFPFIKGAWLHPLLGHRKPSTLWGAALGGIVNGLMPCSMTLAVAVTATTADSPLEGGLLMLVFGLGTLPSMLFVSTLFSALGTTARGLLLKGAAVVVIMLGIATLYKLQM
ncbi:Urease accessory protein UreH-like transmembrane domain-containing protein [Gammaproteobacteria bacterium]